MRLTAIHLNGFKSFADKTAFPVDAPLTGILGPNGCGKSNIIDAVRWVLGESAAKQLRGQAMSDVIFAGCATRGAGRQASVELHFDNSEGKAGGAFADYAELVIRREVEHDGQSRYLINKKRCRRKDIVELLQGSGVGARSYAVIEQGMISRVIDAKPDELRGYIEEAAGIAVYQNRRKDSERKMALVNDHLSRHDDRLYELGKQRERLAGEAENAKRYRSLQRQLLDTQHCLDSWRLHRTALTYAEQQQIYEAAQAALIEHTAALTRVESRHNAQQEKAKSAELALRQVRTLYNQARDALREGERKRQYLSQRCEHAKQQCAQQDKRLEQIVQQQADDQRQLRDTQQRIAEQREHLSELDAVLPERERQRDADKHELERLRFEAQRQQSIAEQAHARRDAARAHHRQISQRLGAQKRRLVELDALNEPDDLTQQHQDALTLLDTLHVTLGEAQMAEQEAVEKVAEYEETLAHAQAQREAAQHQWQQANSRAQTLREWQQHKDRNELPRPGYARLIEQLDVQPEWQSALELFLGTRLQAWHDDQADRESAIRYGEAFVAKGDVPPAWRGIVNSSAALGDWLGDIQPLAQHDSELAFNTLDAHARYLTLDGTLITAHTVVPISSSEAQGTLARAAALHDLDGALPQLAQAVQDSETAYKAAQAHVQQARQQQQQCRANVKQYEHALNSAQRDAALLGAQMQHQTTLRAEREQVRRDTLRDVAALEMDLARAERALTQAAQEEYRPPVDREQLQQAQAVADASWQAYQSVMREQQAMQQQLASLIAQEQAYIEREARNRRELTTLQDERRIAEQTLREDEAALAALDAWHVSQRQHCDEQRMALEEAELSAHDANEQWRQSDKDISERRHRIELEQARIEQLDERLARSAEILHQLSRHFQQSDRKPLRFDERSTLDDDALEAEIQRYQRDVEALGAVNQTAIDAFAEVDEEYQALQQQCDDLRASLTMLDAAIAELDKETRVRLSDTMAVVNHHFSTLFPRLFRGGEAALTWTDDDVLQAGIRIKVRPPGKNVKSLSVLSGGEKALTAIALVFALFRLNPAPFCLLDEVDAPLDDGNVNRLTDLLRDMAGETQFIVITHHKSTMQACDHLIGVTMSEPGISRLVAVQMDV